MPGEARENRVKWLEDCPVSAKKVVGILYELS
jgi:biotin-(acetyl-CoA carboxylase) ligase